MILLRQYVKQIEMEVSLLVYSKPYAGIAEGRLEEHSLSRKRHVEGPRCHQDFYKTRRVYGLISVNSP